jgi:7,8-dihydropterin-6-yl-methyl-4-(beta-D-ribofuranosyl)aminobenzene 5'-phosphate synthase
MIVSNKTLQINFLIENNSRNSFLQAEHGLSLLIECDGQNHVLFDTGKSGEFIQNALKLNKDLGDVRAVALSHGHYDHTGGLTALAKKVVQVPVYFHPNIFETRYHHRPDDSRHFIGMSEESRLALSSRESFEPRPSRGSSEIAPGVWFSGEVPRTQESSLHGGDDFRLEDGSPDRLLDDASLFVNTEAGLVLICGCAHAGVPSILAYVGRLAHGARVIGIVGGLHLRHSKEEELVALRNLFVEKGIKFVAGCHCTGENALHWLEQNWQGTILRPVTGSVLVVENGNAWLKE